METGVDITSRIESPKGNGVFLFRYENPFIPNRNPNSLISRDEVVGKWFTDSPESLKSIIKIRPSGGTIVTVEVSKDKLEEYRAVNHPIAKDMDIELDNYIVPDEILGKAQRQELGISTPGRNFRSTEWKAIDEFVDRIVNQLKQPAKT